jgi:CNT family concentrative nucleoside transporter
MIGRLLLQTTLPGAGTPVEGVPLAARAMGLVGLATMIGIAWLLSSDRKRIPWRLVATGVALQAVLGFLVLKTGVGRALFNGANVAFTELLSFTEQGARFIFGNLVRNNVPVGTPAGSPTDMAPLGEPSLWAATGAYFAFGVLPTIIFFSSLTSVLYYLGILQRVVRGMAWLFQRLLGTSGAETLSATSNIFVGQTEAPLLIKPFVKTMTVSELNTVMIGGFATIAGGVMAAYVGMLSPYFPDIAGHLLTASVMNAPAGLFLSKMLVPETGDPVTKGTVKVELEKTESSVIEAAAAGAGQGLQLALNVGAMLLAFIALVAMINAGVGALGDAVGLANLSLERLFGWALAPLAWLMGVPWQDAGAIGSLIGVKTVLNEFVAYLQLAGTLSSGVPALHPRSAVIATYALLGFANFSSIAIQIGGIGGLAPERRGDLAKLGLKAMIGGNLAAFMSASLAGMLL